MPWPSAHERRRPFIWQSIWRLLDKPAWQRFSLDVMVSKQIEKHQYWHLYLQSLLCFRKTLVKVSLSHCTALRGTEMSSFALVILWQIIWKIVSVTMEVSTLWKTNTFPSAYVMTCFVSTSSTWSCGQAGYLWLELFLLMICLSKFSSIHMIWKLLMTSFTKPNSIFLWTCILQILSPLWLSLTLRNLESLFHCSVKSKPGLLQSFKSILASTLCL